MRNLRASVCLLLLASSIVFGEPSPVHVSSEEAKAHLLQHPAPKLPAEAQAQHMSGTVGVQVRISPAGDVEPIRIIAGNPILANAAMQELRSWKYRPFLIKGAPAEVMTEVIVEFRAPPPSRVQPYLFAGLLSALVLIAFTRGVLFNIRDAHWRSRIRLIAVIIVSLSWVELLGEVFYRRVLDLPYNLSNGFVVAWVGANLSLCLLAAGLSLAGKGRGRVAVFLAAPMLVFTWAIHYAM